MFPSEMTILMAIVSTRDSGRKLLTRPMDVVGEYIGYLCDSLVKRGYLKKDGSGEYQLTRQGRKALLEFLHQNKTKVKDAINDLEQLGIEINQRADILEKETIGVT